MLVDLVSEIENNTYTTYLCKGVGVGEKEEGINETIQSSSKKRIVYSRLDTIANPKLHNHSY